MKFQAMKGFRSPNRIGGWRLGPWYRASTLIILMAAASYAAASDSVEVDRLLAQADAVRTSDTTKFIQLLGKLDGLKVTASSHQKLKIDYLRAYETALYKDDFASGIAQAKAVYEKTADPDLKFRAGNLVANLSAIKRDFSTGLHYLESTLLFRSKVKDKNARYDATTTAAIFYNEMGQPKRALRFANEVLQAGASARLKCFASSARLKAEYDLKMVTQSDRHYEQGIDICLKSKETMATVLLHAVQARKWADEGRRDDAVDLLTGALPQVSATKYPRLVAEIRSVLSQLKLAKGDIVGAEAHARATVELGDAIASTQALVTAYDTLYQIAEQRGQSAEALDLYKQYAKAEKAYLGDIKAREIANEIFREQTEQQEQQLALAREGKQKANLAMVFLMLLLVGIIFWLIQIKRHQGQLQRLAQTDTLTGLGNRHFFTQKSERALIDAARAGQPASLVMFDLDHFKAINDTYGHGAGDWVLKQVGKTCSSHCRKVDYLGRIGGEEFAVLLHGLDLSAAARLAEDCRSQLAQIDTRECGYSFVVTASFGVSSTAQSGYDLSRLLSHADQMLYRAKNEGRNRVCAYTAETAADHKSPKRTPTLSVVGG